MLRKGQEGHVRAERDILKSASLVNSPNGADWIVRLIYSFQDRDHLYLVSVVYRRRQSIGDAAIAFHNLMIMLMMYFISNIMT
jgi:hypothetical protein